MCGIAGIVSTGTIASVDIQRMSTALSHRGPDGEGFMLSQGTQATQPLPGLIDFSPALPCHVALAHRRLAIVDLSPQGHQPMVWQARYVITFNGEIYNHVELRAELETQGYCFSSHSDTEVILAAYDAWGAACLKRFNGMWAFMIIDCLEKKVFISRDRFGIKPFYYYQDSSKFIFASEIKAILQHSGVLTEPNIEYCRAYLDSGCTVDGSETAFKNIWRFPPASFMECRIDQLITNAIQASTFWDLEPNLSNEAFDEHKAARLASEYYTLLEDAVRLRLRADVKVGSALSGGLDSSSIVYLVNKLLKEQGHVDRQETFSSVYKTPGTEDCDESEFIDTLASYLNVQSNQIEPQIDDVPAEHKKMIYMMDHPPESTCMSGWHTFKKVSESDVVVTLDGQGADEQLAGYLPYLLYWFSQMPIRGLFQEMPSAIRIPEAKRFVIQGAALNILSRIFGHQLITLIVGRLGYHRNPFTPLNQVLLQDTQKGLGTLIHYSDRVSMAFSIESRMPFMDYRIVEFLASVPAVYKLHGGWTKYLARQAFSGKLPDEIVWRKDKKGWPIPEAYWFNGKLKSWLITWIQRPGFLKWLGVDGIESTLGSGIGSMIFKVRLLNLSVWHASFFEKQVQKSTKSSLADST